MEYSCHIHKSPNVRQNLYSEDLTTLALFGQQITGLNRITGHSSGLIHAEAEVHRRLKSAKKQSDRFERRKRHGLNTFDVPLETVKPQSGIGSDQVLERFQQRMRKTIAIRVGLGQSTPPYFLFAESNPQLSANADVLNQRF